MPSAESPARMTSSAVSSDPSATGIKEEGRACSRAGGGEVGDGHLDEIERGSWGGGERTSPGRWGDCVRISSPGQCRAR
jgi:hypothetical protein